MLDGDATIATLSFEDTREAISVEIEFTKEQWKGFLGDMKKAKWIKEEHSGAC